MTLRIPNLTFRGVTEADTSFVFSAWLKSQRGAPGFAAQASSIYFPRMHSVVEALWFEPKVAWVVACDAEHTDFIHGFLCGQRAQFVDGQSYPVIHMVYVRKVSRRFGVASALLETFDTRAADARSTPYRISTLSPTAREILRTRPGRFVLDPWLLWAYVGPGRKRAVDAAMRESRAEARALARTKDDELGLGWRDPAPRVATPTDEEDFAAEFAAMAREAGKKGGMVR